MQKVGEKMVAVSVIMPVYNAEKYIRIALDSLLSQNMDNIEIICVDDGSTDNSYKILQEYQKKDNRVIVLQQKNQYAGVARNAGMKIARGKYLSFLDADDYFEKDMLEKAYICAEMQKADVVVYGGKCFDEDIKLAYIYPSLLKEDLIPAGDGFNNYEKIENLMIFTTPAPWNKLFNHEFIRKNQLEFQACKRVNDAYFVKMALVLANRIGVVRESLVAYRRGNSDSLQGTNNESPMQWAEVYMDIRNRLLQLGLYSQVEKSFRNMCLTSAIYTLESLTDAVSFEKSYMLLRDKVFEEFNIKGSARSDYYNRYAYDKYLYIISHSPLEYWMDKYSENFGKIVKQYLFPYSSIGVESKIILYGAGQVGRSFYKQIRKTHYCQLVAWVDISIKSFGTYRIKQPQDVNWENCDYVVIAIESQKIVMQIRKTLIDIYDVPNEKIIWENPIL